MFMYEKDGKIQITFNSNGPVENPDYVLSADVESGALLVNDVALPVAEGADQCNVLLDDKVYETAQEITHSMILNLNGHSVSIPEDPEGNGVFWVKDGGSLTINGDGVINGVGKNDYNMAIWADGGNVVINGGTFTNVGAFAEDTADHFDLIYAKSGGVVEINGGTFICATPKWTLNNNDKNPGTFIVKGGTFVGFDPSATDTEPGGVTNFVAPGYKVVVEGNNYSVVPE